MLVGEIMSRVVLEIGPSHTLRQAATLMSRRRVGAAIVHDPDGSGVGILTERDILYAIGAGLNPDVELAAGHITWDVVYAGPAWSVEEAANAMVRGGFRHLVVLDAGPGGAVLGVLSVRDILRVWTAALNPATPAQAGRP